MERGADPMIGRVLDGRYRIEARIARGGMATVYRAHDQRLDRVCAVKVMHPDLGDGHDSPHASAHDFRSRFVKEAHAAARLSHPNVVAVTDQGDDAGRLFLVMEHVPGRTLRHLMREEGAMPPARALALLEPVLLALAEAHRCGLVHRDVKPENVLIADDGRVKVADFGLARAFDAETTHTATGGMLIGTVSYLAPELIVDGRADPRSDVYAAGVLLFEMLTGRKPHEGEGAIQIAFKHVNEDVPAPSQVLTHPGAPIPSYVDALVLRATARDRDHRPADAKVLLQQLRRVRAAVEAGELEDAELTADLLPAVPAQGDELHHEPDATLRELSPVVDAEDATTVIGPLVDPVIEPASLDDTGPLLLARERRAVPVGAGARGGGPSGPGDGRPAGGQGGLPRQPAPPRPGPDGPGAIPPGATAVRRGRSRRGPVLLVAVVVVTVLTAYVGWWLGIGRYTSTPGVINLSVSEARARVEAEGLELAVAREEFSETVPAGSVISTDPSPGSDIVEGGTVEAVVSKGPERYEVPPVRGKPLAEAQALIEGTNLTVGVIKPVWNEKVPEGAIVAADPGAGTELRRDQPVNLFVSKGRKPIDIPDLTGKDAEKAQARLEKLGFDVEVTEENSDTVEKGRVISQDPAGGTGYRDDVIDLVVSKGPVLVEVPNLKTMSVEEATAALEAVGLKIRVERTNLYVGLDRVVGQSPGDGQALPKGDVVTVSVV